MSKYLTSPRSSKNMPKGIPYIIGNELAERFTEDAADAVLKIINTNYTGIINLGTGQMNSIKKITDIIERMSGKKIYSENKPVSGPMEFVTDISKIKNITGWSPKYNIEEGIKKTYEIMKKYYQF